MSYLNFLVSKILEANLVFDDENAFSEFNKMVYNYSIKSIDEEQLKLKNAFN